MKVIFFLLAFLVSGFLSKSQEQDVRIIRGSDYFDSTVIKKSDSQINQKEFSETTKQPAANKNLVTYHTVLKSQTLYSISKLYGKTVDQVKEWNNLVDNNIQVGQKLIVDKTSENEVIKSEKVIVPVAPAVKVDVPAQMENVAPVSETDIPVQETNFDEPEVKPVTVPVSIPVTEVKSEVQEVPSEKVEFAKGRKEINETGTAICMDEDEITPEKYYAFHKSAPIGTIIWITNISNAEKIYVKVIGNLPDSKENQGAIIKVSRLSAEKLGVKERKFEANLIYGINEE